MPTSVAQSAVVPQHVIAKRAQALSRRIYCSSMPWGYRIAGLLVVLATDSLEAFGRTIYAEMIKSVVRGMPDADTGKSAFDLLQDVERKGADALPSGYGRSFASRVFNVFLAKYSDPLIIEEAMSDVTVKALRGKLHFANGSSLHSAESYVLVALGNAIRDRLRTRGRRREDSLVRDDDDREVDITDPEAFRGLDKSIGSKDMQRILSDAERISPKAREYLESILRGDTQSEWARDLGVSDAAVSKFVRKIRPTLKKVLHDHLRSAAMVVSYDFR